MDIALNGAVCLLLSLLLSKVSAVPLLQVSSPDYCYVEYWCGSCQWEITFPYCASDFALSQSPVNLHPLYMKRNMSMAPLVLEGYDATQSKQWAVMNIRDTVAVEFNPGMRLMGGSLTRAYNAFYMAFHWGSLTTNGSEHQYNKRKYPMEMQIYHVVPPYQNIVEAAYIELQSVAILAVFIDIGPEDNPVFEAISSVVPQVPLPGNVVYINAFPLLDLLPNDTSKFYQYPGSLTFPDCLTGIQWVIFEEPIYISQKQYERFTTSVYYHEPGEEPKLQHDNYRHINALFYRTIQASPNATIPEPSTTCGLAASRLAVLATGFVAFQIPRMM